MEREKRLEAEHHRHHGHLNVGHKDNSHAHLHDSKESAAGRVVSSAQSGCSSGSVSNSDDSETWKMKEEKYK